MPRRCAWCRRFCVNGRWIAGRRADDDSGMPMATHSICSSCAAQLRFDGLSV